MRTAAMMFLIVFGILTVPGLPWLGAPMVGAGLWIGQGITHEDTSRFVGVMFILGVLGFAAAFVVGAPGR